MAETGGGAAGPVSGHVLGVDSGGSGLRIAVARADERDARPLASYTSQEPIGTGPNGMDAHQLLKQLVPAAQDLMRDTGAGRFDAVCVGAAGMATLGTELRAELPGALAETFGVRRLALAADAVTAYAGALGQQPGAVVAAGTGVIAMGTDLTATGGWRRADGWGHLLGDCGSGAWIGRAGLEAALRAHDGRAGGSAVLLSRMEALFGPAGELPGMLYPRADRTAVLASFAPEVAASAGHDPVAAAILTGAARHLAEAAAAVCPSAAGSVVAFTGGLLRLGEPLLTPLRTAFDELLPRARRVEAEGDPLGGALRVAAALANDRLLLPTDEKLLRVTR
ncbi:BadF/BadG/BcrA/BcrD ATPase family protein [Streptomyces sp. NPDC052496]|uniref:N-acetylglucosamine kinase n=1 Tax=Streptomyces sp. NPDC052496 TaxID=3154951 RepID=UPI0034297645